MSSGEFTFPGEFPHRQVDLGRLIASHSLERLMVRTFIERYQKYGFEARTKDDISVCLQPVTIIQVPVFNEHLGIQTSVVLT